MAEEKNYKEAGEQPPSTVEQQAPSVAEENAPSTESDVATDIPTANAPEPDENLVENPEAAREKGTPVTSEEKSAAKPATKAAAPAAKASASEAEEKQKEESAAKPAAKAAAAKAKGDKPAAAKAAKKEKAPAVEDKPFTEFMQQDYLPALQKAFAAQGVQGVDLTFNQQKFPIAGYEQDECWQVIGRWQKDLRQFNIYFPQADIQGQKFFSCNEGSRPSTLEHFLGDERKMSLDLMIYGVMQRLNGQKWLARN